MTGLPTALEAARRIADGSLTSEALVRACLDRISEREPLVQAWQHLDMDAALKMARHVDRFGSGPLKGIPVGVKDIIDTAEMPTGYGSPLYETYRPPRDAACVALARHAGALVLGKTVTTEFAYFQPGKTRNPHDPNRTPGGSSSGSAAAVADGMVPLALGTQTAGSVIRPASFCGCVGYKPTFGLIDRTGVRPLPPAASSQATGSRSRSRSRFRRWCCTLPLSGPVPSTSPSTPPIRWRSWSTSSAMPSPLWSFVIPASAKGFNNWPPRSEPVSKHSTPKGRAP